MESKHIGDYIYRALSGDIVLTKFLDFDEQKEVSSINQKDIIVDYFGGYPDSERKRALIYSSLYEEIDKDYHITIIQSVYNPEFTTICHRNVLGAICALGIKRNTFGDIIVKDNVITIFVSDEIVEFVMDNLLEINHMKMKWQKVLSFTNLLEEVKQRTIVVSSIRLDAILSKALNISRNDSADLIKSGHVMINHHEVNSISMSVNPTDIISIRKYGRVTLEKINYTTKKDKINLSISVKH